MNFKKFFYVFIIGIAVIFVIYFLARNVLLHYVLHKAQEKFKSKYDTALLVTDAYFSGFSTVNADGVVVLPPGTDTLLVIQHIKADISFLRLLANKLPYKKLSADTIYINLVKHDSTDNYSVFVKGKKENADSTETKNNTGGYGTILNNLLNKTFDLLSGEVYVNRLSAKYISNTTQRYFIVPFLSLKSKEFNLSVTDSSFENIMHWNVNGTLNKNTRNISCNIALNNESKNLIPLLNRESEFKYGVDSVFFEVNSYNFRSDKLTVDLSFAFRNLKLNHWRIAPNDVSFDSLIFNGHLTADENKIGFDTSSSLGINKIKFDFSYFYERSNGKNFALNVDMPKTSSQDFFESLPDGMFSTLKGIKTSGQLSYHLNFNLNRQQPDSLTFDSELKKYDFKILKFGEEYFPGIKGSFSYTAYNDYGPVRTFIVGPENPNFIPLIQISDYLKNAVLTSEDGAFFSHRGFNEDAFRASIATNVKQGRFARGGSTISMQLVKNVFLSRNKTVSRKIEEALIVWLIENNYLVNKDRMYEIYLNIIEWGPDVYGAREAASFYFSKHPMQLSLAESVYLASIVPHPKYFKYSFDTLGNLKPFLAGYYKIIAEHLLKKEKITQPDYDALQPTVKLTGPALQFVLPKETLPPDSLKDDQEIL